MPWREPDDPAAWADLSPVEYDEVWNRIYTDLAFRPGTRPDAWPSFREPTSSATWSTASAFTDLEQSERIVAGLLRDGLNDARGDDEYVYALDWQHPGYRFFPACAQSPTRLDSWLVPALPNGDYYLFVARDLRFGWLSHPWEGSVCIFGNLLHTMEPSLTALGWTILRSN